MNFYFFWDFLMFFNSFSRKKIEKTENNTKTRLTKDVAQKTGTLNSYKISNIEKSVKYKNKPS